MTDKSKSRGAEKKAPEDAEKKAPESAEKSAPTSEEKKAPFMDRLGRAYDGNKGSGLSQLALLSLLFDEANDFFSGKFGKSKPSLPAPSEDKPQTPEEMYQWHQAQTKSSPIVNGFLILIFGGFLVIGGFVLAWLLLGTIGRVALVVAPIVVAVWLWRKLLAGLQIRHKHRLESVWRELPVALRDAGVTFTQLCLSYQAQAKPLESPWAKVKKCMKENLDKKGFWNSAFEAEVDNLMLEVMQLATKAYPSEAGGVLGAEENFSWQIRANYIPPFPEDAYKKRNVRSRPLVAGLKKALAKS